MARLVATLPTITCSKLTIETVGSQIVIKKLNFIELNPNLPSVPFLYTPYKHHKTYVWCSDIFRGHIKREHCKENG